MRYVDINTVEPGQILGRSIFSSNGTVLLAENVQLTVYMISTLKRVGVTMLYIKNPQFDDVELEEVVSEETKRAVMGKMIETFDAIRSGKEFHTKQLSVTVDGLLEEIFQNKDVLVQLTDIRSDDNYHYVHALNVCMMSVLVGLNCGFNAQQLKDLAIGALLHDIGKIGLEPEEESDNIKQHHTWRGFEIIKNKHELSLMSAHVALQHHERIDGQGLPRGIEGDTIHPYAKIVAVANAFDNLVAPRSSTGKPIMPHEACERLMAMAGSELDREYVIEFLKIVSVYPTGITVQLTTKETGVIVGQHRGLPSRPIVRIVRVDSGMNDMEVKEIDLARNPTVFIEKVVN